MADDKDKDRELDASDLEDGSYDTAEEKEVGGKKIVVKKKKKKEKNR